MIRRSLAALALLSLAATSLAQDKELDTLKKYLKAVKGHVTESYIDADKVDKAALEPAAVDALRRALDKGLIGGLKPEAAKKFLDAIVGMTKNDEALEAVAAAKKDGELDADLWKLADAMANGMVKKAGDAYGRAMSPQDLGRLLQMLTGSRSRTSAGLAVHKEEEEFKVVFIQYRFAADVSGVRMGDTLLRIDGEDVTKLEPEIVMQKLALETMKDVACGKCGSGEQKTEKKGATETTVCAKCGEKIAPREITHALTLKREGYKEPVEITLKAPDRVPGEVEYEMVRDGVAYLRLTIFDSKSARLIRKAVADLVAQGVRGIVFDLRNNPGGDLRNATNIADQFLGQGLTIATVDMKYNPASLISGPMADMIDVPDKYVTRKQGPAEDLPMVCLINGSSASASELLAGALKDHGRATLVGSHTYGKGVGQSVIPLVDIGMKRYLYLTILRYKTPSGADVGHNGIPADVEVEPAKLGEADFRAAQQFRASKALAEYVEELWTTKQDLARELARWDGFDASKYPNLAAMSKASPLPMDVARQEIRRALRQKVESADGKLLPCDVGADGQLQQAILILLKEMGADHSKAAGEPKTMRDVVEYLASDEMKGRLVGSAEGRRAATWIADRFKALGLAPAGDDGYFHRFALKDDVRGVNVIGRLEGSDPALKGECVVIAAHHDHVGVRKGEVCNGADDNASGVAMVLELAKRLREDKPKRSILFMSYDAEEGGLLGSRAYVNSDLFKKEKFRAMICFDLIGGNFVEWEKDRVYALGAESSPELRALLESSAKGAALDVAPAGVYMIEPVGPILARSDYANFRAKKVPFVFFSSGTPWYYHTPHDDVERLNFEKMEKAAVFCRAFSLDVANGAGAMTFERAPKPRASDAAILRDAIDEALKRLDGKGLDADAYRQTRARMAEIAEKAELTEEDRKEIQGAMVRVFEFARLKPK